MRRAGCRGRRPASNFHNTKITFPGIETGTGACIIVRTLSTVLRQEIMRLNKSMTLTNHSLRSLLIIGAAALLQACAEGESANRDADINVSGTSENATISAGDKAV